MTVNGGKNPLVKTGGGSQFNEKDLFQANNIYNFMDKHQHIYQNKMFAQSSINQIKLKKESDKFNALLFDPEE